MPHVVGDKPRTNKLFDALATALAAAGAAIPADAGQGSSSAGAVAGLLRGFAAGRGAVAEQAKLEADRAEEALKHDLLAAQAATAKINTSLLAAQLQSLPETQQREREEFASQQMVRAEQIAASQARRAAPVFAPVGQLNLTDTQQALLGLPQLGLVQDVQTGEVSLGVPTASGWGPLDPQTAQWLMKAYPGAPDPVHAALVQSAMGRIFTPEFGPAPVGMEDYAAAVLAQTDVADMPDTVRKLRQELIDFGPIATQRMAEEMLQEAAQDRRDVVAKERDALRAKLSAPPREAFGALLRGVEAILPSWSSAAQGMLLEMSDAVAHGNLAQAQERLTGLLAQPNLAAQDRAVLQTAMRSMAAYSQDRLMTARAYDQKNREVGLFRPPGPHAARTVAEYDMQMAGVVPIEESVGMQLLDVVVERMGLQGPPTPIERAQIVDEMLQLARGKFGWAALAPTEEEAEEWMTQLWTRHQGLRDAVSSAVALEDERLQAKLEAVALPPDAAKQVKLMMKSGATEEDAIATLKLMGFRSQSMTDAPPREVEAPKGGRPESKEKPSQSPVPTGGPTRHP